MGFFSKLFGKKEEEVKPSQPASEQGSAMASSMPSPSAPEAPMPMHEEGMTKEEDKEPEQLM